MDSPVLAHADLQKVTSYTRPPRFGLPVVRKLALVLFSTTIADEPPEGAESAGGQSTQVQCYA